MICCILVNINIAKVYHSLSFIPNKTSISKSPQIKNELDAQHYVLQLNSSLDHADKMQIQEWIAREKPSPESFCELGSSCELLQIYDKAEKYYQIAADMIPNQVRGNYYLFKLYEKLGRHQDAYRTAIIISKQYIKIENTFTLSVQGEIKRYLMKHQYLPIIN